MREGRVSYWAGQAALLLAGSLLVASCFASDYAPERHVNTIKDVKIVMQSRERTIESCRELGARVNVQHPGCANADVLTYADGRIEIKSCTIYAVEPRDVNDDSTLFVGHELLHCIRGHYHTAPE